MADGIVAGLKSAAGAAYSAGKQVAGATQRAVAPHIVSTASSCQLVSALQKQLGKDIGDMLISGQQDQANRIVESSKRLNEVAKALSCPVK